MGKKLIWVALEAIFIILVSNVQVFSTSIGRKLTLQEVVSQSTNIVYGTVEKVDAKRQRL